MFTGFCKSYFDYINKKLSGCCNNRQNEHVAEKDSYCNTVYSTIQWFLQTNPHTRACNQHMKSLFLELKYSPCFGSLQS